MTPLVLEYFAWVTGNVFQIGLTVLFCFVLFLFVLEWHYTLITYRGLTLHENQGLINLKKKKKI